MRFTLPGGAGYRRELHDLPNQRLAAGLAQGLAAAAHPHGPIRTRSVASQYVQTMRRLARELHDQGFTGDLAELTPAILVRYWLGCDYQRERRIRVVLGAYQDCVGGLAEGIARHLTGRRINKVIKSEPNRPYSDGAWQRLGTACTEAIAEAHRAYRAARDGAERGTDPAVAGVTADNLAWLLARSGPLATGAVLDRLGATDASCDLRTQILTVHRALFPSTDTAFAYLTLFAMRTGIVPDGIDAMTLGDITRTSPSSILLSYSKGRTGGEALNLPRDAVRLLDRWLGHSALLREHAGDLADRLWLHTGGDRRGRGNDRIFARPRTQQRRSGWVRCSGLRGDDGEALRIHGGRIRATYHTLRSELKHLTAWFNHLTATGATSLAEVQQRHCDTYLAGVSRSVTDPDRALSPATTVAFVRASKFLALYTELLTDGYRPRFTPWGPRSADEVADYVRSPHNRVPPVPDTLLRPLLANCLYLLDAIGPHLAAEAAAARAADAHEAASRRGLRIGEVDGLREAIQRRNREGVSPYRAAGSTISNRLQLAGTPTAEKPLIGMCDSARCSQATHHRQHRQVWAEHAESTKTAFLGNPRLSAVERARARAAYDRATGIDAATSPEEPAHDA